MSLIDHKLLEECIKEARLQASTFEKVGNPDSNTILSFAGMLYIRSTL